MTWRNFPDPGMGSALIVEPSETFSMGFVVYEGSPNGGRLGLSRLLEGGVFLISQAAVNVGCNLSDDCTAHMEGSSTGPLPGAYHVGAWYHSPDPAATSGDSGAKFSGNYGVLVGGEQQIWSFDPSGERGVSVVGQHGWTPGDRNHVEQYFGAGIVVRGPFVSRLEDSAGVGLAHARFSSCLPTLKPETAIEAYYRLQANDFLSLQPDVQFIANPHGNQKDAMVVGLRFEASY